MKNWTDSYIELPFIDGGRSIAGVDCWGLVRLVYGFELNIELPSYGETSAHELAAVSRNIDAGKDHETWIDVPANCIVPFDVCVMKYVGSRRIGHVGIVVDAKQILHIEQGANAAIVAMSHFTIRERIACFRRHKLTIK